jgi:hypothetical protein
MGPHSPHLPSLTGQSVSRLPNSLSAWGTSSTTYATYPHSWTSNTGARSMFSSPIWPLAAQNAPLSPQKTTFLPVLSLQTGFNCTFLSCRTPLSHFHLQHLRPFMVTYTPARNPHLHTYPPFKGGKCEWWGGGSTKRYNFTQEAQVEY